MKVGKNDKAIRNFMKFLEQVKGPYFMLGHIPEEGLGFFSGRQKKDQDDAVKSWAYEMGPDERSFDLIFNVIKSYTEATMDMGKVEWVEKLRNFMCTALSMLKAN